MEVDFRVAQIEREAVLLAKLDNGLRDALRGFRVAAKRFEHCLEEENVGVRRDVREFLRPSNSVLDQAPRSRDLTKQPRGLSDVDCRAGSCIQAEAEFELTI